MRNSPKRRLVVNASPLICLFGAELEYIFHTIAHEVWVPEAVWKEILNGPKTDRASCLISKVPWLLKVDVQETDRRVDDWGLGVGETQVLSKTLHTPDTVAVVDDAAARRCAKTLGIDFMGTGGLLILAKKLGIVHSVTECIQDLQGAGLWISKGISALLKDKANEL